MKFKITLYAPGMEDSKFSVFSFAYDERGAVDKLIINYPKFGSYIIDSIERLR